MSSDAASTASNENAFVDARDEFTPNKRLSVQEMEAQFDELQSAPLAGQGSQEGAEDSEGEGKQSLNVKLEEAVKDGLSSSVEQQLLLEKREAVLVYRLMAFLEHLSVHDPDLPFNVNERKLTAWDIRKMTFFSHDMESENLVQCVKDLFALDDMAAIVRSVHTDWQAVLQQDELLSAELANHRLSSSALATANSTGSQETEGNGHGSTNASEDNDDDEDEDDDEDDEEDQDSNDTEGKSKAGASSSSSSSSSSSGTFPNRSYGTTCLDADFEDELFDAHLVLLEILFSVQEHLNHQDNVNEYTVRKLRDEDDVLRNEPSDQLENFLQEWHLDKYEPLFADLDEDKMIHQQWKRWRRLYIWNDPSWILSDLPDGVGQQIVDRLNFVITALMTGRASSLLGEDPMVENGRGAPASKASRSGSGKERKASSGNDSVHSNDSDTSTASNTTTGSGGGATVSNTGNASGGKSHKRGKSMSEATRQRVNKQLWSEEQMREGAQKPDVEAFQIKDDGDDMIFVYHDTKMNSAEAKSPSFQRFRAFRHLSHNNQLGHYGLVKMLQKHVGPLTVSGITNFTQIFLVVRDRLRLKGWHQGKHQRHSIHTLDEKMHELRRLIALWPPFLECADAFTQSKAPCKLRVHEHPNYGLLYDDTMATLRQYYYDSGLDLKELSKVRMEPRRGRALRRSKSNSSVGERKANHRRARNRNRLSDIDAATTDNEDEYVMSRRRNDSLWSTRSSDNGATLSSTATASNSQVLSAAEADGNWRNSSGSSVASLNWRDSGDSWLSRSSSQSSEVGGVQASSFGAHSTGSSLGAHSTGSSLGANSTGSSLGSRGSWRKSTSSRSSRSTGTEGDFEDTFLTCRLCGKEFMFGTRDQAFFAKRGFEAPKKCKKCRKTR